MPDKITTLKLIDNTDVFPNIKDENIPDTIMRIADLSKYLNQLKSINITGDIVSTTITSDIATFTTADISTLNVSGVSHFEGDTTFGHNVHVDGNLVVNGIDNIIDKNGNKIINTGTFDPGSDNPAGQKSIGNLIGRAMVIDKFISVKKNFDSVFNLDYLFVEAPSILSGQFSLVPYINWNWAETATEIYMRFMCAGSRFAYFNLNETINIAIKRLPFSADYMFFDSLIEKIDAYDFGKCTSLYNAFFNCNRLQELLITNISVSFDLSTSNNLTEANLIVILNNLMDLTGKTSQTLTLGKTNLAKLTDSEKAIATNKNWTLA